MKKFYLSIFAASALIAANIDFEHANGNFERVNPEFGKDSVVLSYHSSINEAKKSVVNISTSRTIKSKGFSDGFPDIFNDPFFQEFFGKSFGFPDSRSEKQRKASSLGSGVIISSDGYIVTNNHVIEDADEIIVTMLDDTKEYEAKIIGNDPTTDLAIIKIEGKNLKPIKIADSDKLLEGDIVFAIGNPFGVGGTITQGIISALNKNNIGLNKYENFIQTDASINPGNSGGALVDSRGALIGINSAILSRSGGNNGVGFAIPSNMVKDVTSALIKDGKIERGYIGVLIADLTKEQKEIYKNQEGALVSSVEKDKPAEAAGLKIGDLIIQADDKEIKSANDFKNYIGSKKPGTTVKVRYERGGDIKTANVKLEALEAISITARDITESQISGLVVENLTSDIRKELNLDEDINGVLVSEVKRDSDAEDYGFIKNDLIIQVDQKEIKSVDEFQKALKSSKGKKLVWVMRDKIPLGIVVK